MAARPSALSKYSWAHSLIASDSYAFRFCHLAEGVPCNRYRAERGEHVAHRLRHFQSGKAEPSGQYQYQWDEKQSLPCRRHEVGFPGHAAGLHHHVAHHHEAAQYVGGRLESQRVHAYGYHVWVISEEGDGLRLKRKMPLRFTYSRLKNH